MFTWKKSTPWAIVALCLLALMLIWTPPALGQSGADVPPPATLHLPHDVDRLPDGHTLITDGGQPGGPTGSQPGSGSKIIEVDADGSIVWQYPPPPPSSSLRLSAVPPFLDWPRDADRLSI